MSSIFISYRSRDFDHGVSVLHRQLKDLYGAENITFDKSTFSPGSTWLPQILSRVAMSDIIICAIGPTWISSRESPPDNEADYVVEELNLARQLGKPVLPVALNADPIEVRRLLPKPITWLSDLHFFRFDPTTTSNAADIAVLISNLGGPRAQGTAKEQRAPLAKGNSALWRVMRGILGSVLRPTSFAAAALQPNLASLWQSVFLAITSVLLLSFVGVLIGGEISSFMVAKFIALLAGIALLNLAIFTGLARYAQSRPATLSLASFSIHCSAALHTAFAIWGLVFWFALPDAVQARFTSIASGEVPVLQQLESLWDDLTVPAAVTLAAVQLGALVHIVLIVYGMARAGVISLHWKRWRLLVPLSVLAVVFLLTASWLLSSGAGVRHDELPRHVKLGWIPDRIDADGLKRAPFLFEVSGVIEKRKESILFRVESFRAENRDQPTTEIRSLMCALGMLKAGKFEWPDVMHEGRALIGHQLARDQSIRRESMLIDIPLGPRFYSGATVLNCYIEVPTGSYPISDGRQNVLRW